MSTPQSDIGLIGLAVMGENVALNIESKGFPISVFNRTVSKVDDFMNGSAKGKRFFGAHSLEEFVGSLKKPRKVILFIKAGSPVDEFIDGRRLTAIDGIAFEADQAGANVGGTDDAA